MYRVDQKSKPVDCSHAAHQLPPRFVIYEHISQKVSQTPILTAIIL